jgi:WD40 repeat protein
MVRKKAEEEVREYNTGKGVILQLLFPPDGEMLVCLEGSTPEEDPAAVHWIDLTTGKQVRVVEIPQVGTGWEIGRAFLSPDGTWIAVQYRCCGFRDSVSLALWGDGSGEWSDVIPSRECYCVDAAAFSPDGTTLVYASGTDGGGTHSLDRMPLGHGDSLPSIPFPRHGHSIRFLVFSSDGQRLAVATYGGLSVYAYRHGAPDTNVPELTMDEADSIAFSPNSTEVAILTWNKVLFWDGAAPEADRWSLDAGGLSALAWTPDGQSVALGCRDGTVRFRNRTDGRETHAFAWEIGPVSALAFAPDGMTCAAGSENGRIIVWDVD